MAEIILDTIASVPAVNQYIRSASSYNVDCAPLLKKAGIDAAILTDNHKYWQWHRTLPNNHIVELANITQLGEA